MLLLPISTVFFAIAKDYELCACDNTLLIILSPSAQSVTQHACVS